jgi:hypothetical protein
MSSRKFAEALIVITGLIAGGVGAVRGAAATEPSGSTADFYRDINQMLTVDCPATSNLEFPGYPPFGTAWDEMEKAAWVADQPALARLREARSIQPADWPDAESQAKLGNENYLYKLRKIANHVGDAAVYQHLRGDDAGAIDTLGDLSVMSDLLTQKPWDSELRPLVTAGMRAMMDDRLMLIASDVGLADDPADHRKLQIASARALIARLLAEEGDLGPLWDAAEASGRVDVQDPGVHGRALAVETFHRVDADQTFIAMSLACHLFFHDHGRWPGSVDELVPAYLPHPSVDPWGDGHQMIGYVLVKGGLPDGADRPMVYSRCGSQDGLFYRADRPEYGFYSVRPLDPSPVLRLHGGQFRDVTAWLPAAGLVAQPTTRSFE